MALERALRIAGQIIVIFVVRIGQMPEGEDFLRVGAAWVRCIVDLHHIRQLKRIELLRKRHAAPDPLLRVEVHFVPKNLARQRQHLVGIAPGHVDASRLQELLRRDQALGRQLVVSE